MRVHNDAFKRLLKWLFVSKAVLIFIPTLLIAPKAQGQLPSKIIADDQAYRDYMLKITRQLGTTCAACHNLNNFSSSEKIEFKTSKDHIRITQALIDAGFDGQNKRPMADCYMCHRGKMKPDYREPFDPLTMKKSLGSKSDSAPEKAKETKKIEE